MQLIVLGMHRSGTSALARVLNLMGAYFGPEGISSGANKENPKGFWERRDVRSINDSVLHAVGCDWNRVSDFDLRSLPADVIQAFDSQASKLVLDLDAHRPWLIKEPRLCLTFPLWKKFLEVPVCLHILRHPVEVAASLLTRNQMQISVGLALWEAYVRSALASSKDLPCVAVSHHRLMINPVTEVERLYARLSELGVPGLRMPSGHELRAFIDPELYRERSEKSELQQYTDAPQVAIFEALDADLSTGRECIGQTDEGSRYVLAQYEKVLPPLQPKQQAPAQDADKLKERVLVRDQENKILREAVARLEEKLHHGDDRHTESSVEIGRLRATVEHYERELSKLSDEKVVLSEEIEVHGRRLAESNDRLRGAIENYGHELSKLSAREAVLNDQIEARDRRISESDDRLNAATKRIAALEEEAAVKQRDIETLAEQLMVARSKAEETGRALESERQQVQALRSELSRLDLLNQQKDTSIGQQSIDLQRVKSELSKTQSSVDERFHEIALLSRKMLESEKALRNSVSEKVELERLLAARARELDAVHNSRIWRWTRPVRALARRLARFRASSDRSDLNNAIAVIDRVDAFDRNWYLRTYQDVARSGMDPVEHYLRYGAQEGRDPGAKFSTSAYLKRNPDVREAGLNPLLHYVMHGKKEGRQPQ